MANITAQLPIGTQSLGTCDAPPNDAGGTPGERGNTLTYVDPLGVADSTDWLNEDGTLTGWVQQ